MDHLIPIHLSVRLPAHPLQLLFPKADVSIEILPIFRPIREKNACVHEQLLTEPGLYLPLRDIIAYLRGLLLFPFYARKSSYRHHATAAESC